MVIAVHPCLDRNVVGLSMGKHIYLLLVYQTRSRKTVVPFVDMPGEVIPSVALWL